MTSSDALMPAAGRGRGRLLAAVAGRGLGFAADRAAARVLIGLERPPRSRHRSRARVAALASAAQVAIRSLPVHVCIYSRVRAKSILLEIANIQGLAGPLIVLYKKQGTTNSSDFLHEGSHESARAFTELEVKSLRN